MSNQLQSPSWPPATPVYILRGHSAQIHALHFYRDNLRLISGDAQGWIVIWNLVLKRAAAVWKAHEGSILGVESWGRERIVTHGRDSKLIVWQIKDADEAEFDKTLPLEDSTTPRRTPWILHTLTVHTLNFCSFASLPLRDPSTIFEQDQSADGIVVATPGVQDGTISLTDLPNRSRSALIPPPKNTSTGMLMAVGMVRPSNSQAAASSNPFTAPRVIAGYESGHVALWALNAHQKWESMYLARPHSQPVLSIQINPKVECWYSSSADAVLAQHPLESNGNAHITNTKHAGQQGLAVRSDGKILAAAGWDGRVRVYAADSLQEVAVLKWHKEGCYALAFADVVESATKSHAERDIINTKRLTVAEQRIARTTAMHLIAAGSKDGKISLWDIY